MLQQNYFNQYRKSGTATTDFLEEKERILDSLASLSNEIEAPNSIPSQGGFILVHTKNAVSSPSTTTPMMNTSGGVAVVLGEGVWTLATEDVLTPLVTTQVFAVQPTKKVLTPQEAYQLVKKSFDAYKIQREKYIIQRQKEAMSFIEDDDEE